MKKIICIHLLNDYSGSPFILSQSIKALKDANFEVELFTNNTEGFLSNLNIKQHNVFYKRSKYKLLVLMYYIIAQVLLFFKLLRYKNEDVTFYINTMMPFGAGLAGKFFNKEVIYHIHETSIKPNLLKKFLLKIIEITSSKNIYVSNFLAKIEPLDSVKSYIIYNALPSNFTDSSMKHIYPYMSENFNILMICSLKEYKGVLEFVKIAKQLEYIQFSLILNAEKNDITNFFQDINLSENITLFPSQNNLHPFYQNANIVLNLSRVDEWQETFGMTILEAMSYAIPCIVPPIGGPIELVDDSINGYSISSYEVGEIVYKIKHLEENRKLLKTLSDNARAKSQQFKQDMFSRSILKVINE